ncbi:hypothetical protein FKM82_006068 [Ascaphus truei]
MSYGVASLAHCSLEAVCKRPNITHDSQSPFPFKPFLVHFTLLSSSFTYILHIIMSSCSANCPTAFKSWLFTKHIYIFYT